MRYLILSLVAVLVSSVLPVGQVTAANSYETFIGSFCTQVHPPRNCGNYQMIVNLAGNRVDSFLTDLASYTSSERRSVIEETISRMATTFSAYTDPNVKFLAAYYHVRLSDYLYGPSSTSSTDLFGFLFNQFGGSSYTVPRNTDSLYRGSDYQYRYDDRYDDRRYEDAEIINLWSTSSDTEIDSNRDRITIRDRYMSVGVKAGVAGYTANRNAGYRVVAVLDSSNSRYDGRTYVGSYDRSSNYRRIRANIGRYSPRRVTFYLICEDCRSGNRFTASDDHRYDDWHVLDRTTYTIRRDRYYGDDYYYDDDDCDRYYNGSYYYDDCDDDYYDDDYYYDDDRYNRRYDLGIRSLRYDYEIDYDELEIELRTTVRNYGDYETELEDLTFRLEVDNDRLSTSEYEYEHQGTYCDRTNNNYNKMDRFEIEEDDECEIVVEFRIDEDEVDFENERVEIEARIEADRDDYHSNDRRSISFYPRD